MNIHWDWVWTILIIIVSFSLINAIATVWTEPVRTERMRAEAALLEQKRLMGIRK